MSKPMPPTKEEREMLDLEDDLIWGEGETIDLTPYIFPMATITLNVHTGDLKSRLEIALVWRWLENANRDTTDVGSLLTEAILCREAFDNGEPPLAYGLEADLWAYYRDTQRVIGGKYGF